MKKALLILACATIAGCNWEHDNLPSPASACLPHFGAVKLHVVQVRGHDYLLASECFGHCAAIVHAASSHRIVASLPERTVTISPGSVGARTVEIGYATVGCVKAWL